MVALFVFSLLYLTPGDPAAVIAGDIATVEDIERIRQKLGLDQPLPPPCALICARISVTPKIRLSKA